MSIYSVYVYLCMSIYLCNLVEPNPILSIFMSRIESNQIYYIQYMIHTWYMYIKYEYISQLSMSMSCICDLHIWSIEWLHDWPASLVAGSKSSNVQGGYPGPTLFGVDILAVLQQESIRFHSRSSSIGEQCLKVCHDSKMLKRCHHELCRVRPIGVFCTQNLVNLVVEN